MSASIARDAFTDADFHVSRVATGRYWNALDILVGGAPTMIDRHLGSAAQTTGLGSRLRRNDGDHLVERVVALACLLILAIGCYLVMKPFLSALLWGIILTISTWPMHVRPTRALGGRTGASAALLTLAAFTVFLIPLVLLGHNLAENVAQIAAKLQEWRNSGVPRARRPGWRRCRCWGPGSTRSGPTCQLAASKRPPRWNPMSSTREPGSLASAH
ncbi:hypothetical protein JL101_010305 [Skermanella rosea]|uniref:hypothetical protein n=1 Tax=Skermanella rosea TaxID=1817965 RepID=UPI001E4FF3D1|nr:hypothetical protein [Skermanella rosea]UEM05797.1 hypothetical protein JL101_010305 [Skermanella rosea]